MRTDGANSRRVRRIAIQQLLCGLSETLPNGDIESTICIEIKPHFVLRHGEDARAQFVWPRMRERIDQLRRVVVKTHQRGIDAVGAGA
jgi:hypothetical protein